MWSCWFVLSAAFLFQACRGTTPSTPGSSRAKSTKTFAYRRAYESGTSYRYEIRRRYIENGTLKHVERAVSLHTVVPAQPHREQIAFETLIRTTNEEESDLSEQIRTFPPYEVSIAPRVGGGGLDLPSLAGWDMSLVGVVTDLHTFLVAISPQAGIEHVTKAGDHYALSEAAIASWANDDDIPVGQDCIQISITLVQLKRQTAVFESKFMPPKHQCLIMEKSWMENPVTSDVPNNFQQKMKMGHAYGSMWGREEFTVKSTVRRDDGQLLHATMENDLELRLRVGCDEALDSCQHELPLTLRRELTIELLTDSPATAK